MSLLKNLKSANSLHDVAHLLGYEPKALAYILYKKSNLTKYSQFSIPKRTGGKRLISAPYPQLKTLQKRLSNLLQHCIVEINSAREIKSVLSHGFRLKYSIMTNGAIHKNRRYVFNIDLSDFFGTINFGRVRGFFITNRNFNLKPKVATVLAQICCHDNCLPQGSPCSPVISNLIGHILDIRLSSLSNQTGCTYSRYADDLTFSTNKRNFPIKIAKCINKKTHEWGTGSQLEKIISKSGFKINRTKTRMQYTNSRQDVTGLVVNSKVNTRAEYRHLARSMVHRLLKTGSFQRKKITFDEDGNPIESIVNGTLAQLNGILSFIDSVSVFNLKIGVKASEKEKPLKKSDHPDCNEKVYRLFLLYKNFYAPIKPLILCEGKTDNIYIKSAIKSLLKYYPNLVGKNKSKKIEFKLDFFQRNATTGRILGLTGGTGELLNLIQMYKVESKYLAAPCRKQPVILLIDNDKGAKGLFSYVSGITKSKIDKKDSFIYVTDNIYIIPTPLTSSGGDTMIEDFFDKKLLKSKLGVKTLNLSDKGFDSKKEYGKNHFAKYVIKKNEKTIDFTGFKPLLDRIEEVIRDYKKRII